ncbi:MAG: serine/threonine-protein kinase [Thermoplasmatota archaeon]
MAGTPDYVLLVMMAFQFLAGWAVLRAGGWTGRARIWLILLFVANAGWLGFEFVSTATGGHLSNFISIAFDLVSTLPLFGVVLGSFPRRILPRAAEVPIFAAFAVGAAYSIWLRYLYAGIPLTIQNFLLAEGAQDAAVFLAPFAVVAILRHHAPARRAWLLLLGVLMLRFVENQTFILFDPAVRLSASPPAVVALFMLVGLAAYLLTIRGHAPADERREGDLILLFLSAGVLLGGTRALTSDAGPDLDFFSAGIVRPLVVLVACADAQGLSFFISSPWKAFRVLGGAGVGALAVVAGISMVGPFATLAGATIVAFGLTATIIVRQSTRPKVHARGDRFKIERELGRGTSARAVLARDTMLHRTVVLKEALPANRAERAAFVREARLLAQVHHPNVVTIFEVLDDRDPPALVVEYVSGGTLRSRLQAGPISRGEAERVASGLLRGVAAIHAAGIVHRDLKPENVLLDERGIPKISDFGIARTKEHPAILATLGAESGSHPAMGTIAYMAPEQLEGERSDATADVYAAGAILVEVFAGHHYLGLTSESAERARKEIMTAAPNMQSVPARLAPCIQRAVAKRPQDRYHDGAAMLADWDAAHGE